MEENEKFFSTSSVVCLVRFHNLQMAIELEAQRFLEGRVGLTANLHLRATDARRKILVEDHPSILHILVVTSWKTFYLHGNLLHLCHAGITFFFLIKWRSWWVAIIIAAAVVVDDRLVGRHQVGEEVARFGDLLLDREDNISRRLILELCRWLSECR